MPCPVDAALCNRVYFNTALRERSMARHYASKDFFWCMPNALLARYFQGKPMVGELDFAAMSATQHGDFFPLAGPA